MNRTGLTLKYLTHTFIILSFLSICFVQSVKANTDARIRELQTQLSSLPVEDSSYVNILLQMSSAYERRSIDTMMQLATHAYDLSNQLNYKEGLIQAYYYQGVVNRLRGEYPDAIGNFKRALQMSEAIDNQNLRSDALNGLGTIYRYLNDYPSAIDYYLKSLNIREKLNDLEGQAEVTGNLGFAYRKFDDTENAEFYLLKSFELAKALQDSIQMVTSAKNLGVHYENSDRLPEGIKMYKEAIRIAELIHDDRGKAISMGNMGALYSKMGEFEVALDLMKQSLALKQKIKPGVVSIAYAYFHYQSIHYRAKNYEESILYGNKILDILNRDATNELVRHAYQYLDMAHFEKKDFEKAYAYRETYDMLKDSIFNTDRSEQVKRLQTLFETDKKDLMITAQDREIDLLAEANLYQSRLTWAVGILLVILFAMVFLYRSKEFAQKAKRLQEKFSQQLLGYQEEERQRISRDLHDSIGQSLVLIKNKVHLSDEETSNLIGETLEEVRNISKQLHPVLLEKLGLTSSIQKLIDEVDSSTEIFLESELVNIDHLYSKEQELHIFRIIQEAITNMIKHSGTSSASIRIEEIQNTIRCAVIDHGKGFDLTKDASQLQSLGMLTLKERTKILNGKLIIDATKGKGTSIVLVINKPRHERAS